MFGARYFNARHFNARYFSATGGAADVAALDLEYLFAPEDFPSDPREHRRKLAQSIQRIITNTREIQDRLNEVMSFVPSTGVTGTGDTIALSPLLAPSAYTFGMKFEFIVKQTNTGAVTVDVSGLGAVALNHTDLTELQAGELFVGSVVAIQFDGVGFQLISATFPDGTATVPALHGADTDTGIRFEAGRSVAVANGADNFGFGGTVSGPFPNVCLGSERHQSSFVVGSSITFNGTNLVNGRMYKLICSGGTGANVVLGGEYNLVARSASVLINTIFNNTNVTVTTAGTEPNRFVTVTSAVGGALTITGVLTCVVA